MNQLEIAHLKTGAALIAAIDTVVVRGTVDCTLQKITDASTAIADLACVAMEDALRRAPRADVLDDRRRFASRKTHHRARLNRSP